MAEARHTLFTDFLAELGVPHTAWYSDAQFRSMTFRSLFGLSKLLETYGIPNEAYAVADKAQALSAVTPPLLAQTATSFVIVTAITADTVSFRDALAEGVQTTDIADFCRRWTGVLLLAYPGADSKEPDYASHRFTEIGNAAKRWVLAAALLFVLAYLFVTRRLYTSVSLTLLAAVSAAGLYVTWHLVLKSLGIKSRHGDAICGIIDRSGCHTVLDTSASKFFGLFGWSEVGLSYFGVTLGCLLLFPQHTGWLALVNACCCPFSFWSIWYQKYRAKAWCTLCLLSQGCLWLSLACYVCGGHFAHAFPLRAGFFALCATYVAALLGINALMPFMDKNKKTA
ncbi:MAG: hypothetical protein K2K22_05025 [Muribaculaceae bacterium]|nr:hypothetical protein [Muribaculaceae bacterium]MDE6611907.1 hypothetical protein [Muribaculaceae bacterium]